MATFAKDVLYPGTYWVGDGKGGKRAVTYTRQDASALRQRMQDMLDAGLSIPLAAEHQDQGKPLTPEERKAEWVKKLTMGWAARAGLAPEGFLEAEVEVPIEEDAKRLQAVRFVSPEIVNDFVDGTGRLWPGPSITHLAVTPRPVHAAQKPFQPVRMSNVIRLSLEDYKGENMADEREEKEEKEEGREEGKEEEKREEESGEEKKPEEGSGLDLAGLRTHLEGDGYSIPGHINEPLEFLKHLHTAAMSKKAMIDKLLQEVDEDEEEEQPGDPEGVSGSNELPQGVSPENGPVLMSMGGHKFKIIRQVKPGDKKKPAKPEKIRMSQHTDPNVQRVVRGIAKKEIQSRIDRLNVDPITRKELSEALKKELGTVRLSLSDEGEVQGSSVLAQVEMLERVSSRNSFLSDSQLPEDVRAAEPLQGWAGHETKEQVKQTVDDFQAMLPGAK